MPKYLKRVGRLMGINAAEYGEVLNEDEADDDLPAQEDAAEEEMEIVYQDNPENILLFNQMLSFEYMGMQEKLVKTPLTDRCYLTMTQALHCRLGGSPFGPAGTGKTESVKALGHHLGRFVLVFNCDEL
uniref:Dynein heavy chain hydrolytic ATP-binding dynein motor region domain-containing protein n=1 Tax=Ditylenchus dipsaci TaxID=166011 RepID=A0A915E2I0_9BILA